MGVYNELRFWATATGAASRERREETAREEEGGNSGSAACSKCGVVCLFLWQIKITEIFSAYQHRPKFLRTAQTYKPANPDGLNPIVSLSKPEDLRTSKLSVLMNVFYVG